MCFFTLLAEKEHGILDARPWHEQAVLTSGHAVTTTFSISFVLSILFLVNEPSSTLVHAFYPDFAMW
jgi:hypothetical protein